MRTWTSNPTRRLFAIGAFMALLAFAVTLRQTSTVAQESSGNKNERTSRDENEKQHAIGLSQLFRKAAEEIVPAVVTIETSTKTKQVRGPHGALPHGDDGMLEENPFKG